MAAPKNAKRPVTPGAPFDIITESTEADAASASWNPNGG